MIHLLIKNDKQYDQISQQLRITLSYVCIVCHLLENRRMTPNVCYFLWLTKTPSIFLLLCKNIMSAEQVSNCDTYSFPTR